MRVEEIITPENKKRYLLVDCAGEPVEPVYKFLKFKDNANKSRNTLRAYCYNLKEFFEFLEQKNCDYRDVGIDEMAEFVRWLLTPHRNVKVRTIKSAGNEKTLQESTINTYIGSVIEFYDYLMRCDDYSIQLSKKLKKHIPGYRRGFKDFLYHVNKDKDYDAKLLKLKVPKKRPKTLSKDSIALLQDACSNLRDKFLLQLLWESGFRIGKCLSLWLEDFIIDEMKIDLMEYHDVTSLILRLRKKTGIYINPHMFRHSHFDTLRRQGWDWSKIRVRGGWSNVQTPMQIYSHPDDKEMHDSWKKAEATMKLRKTESKACKDFH